MKRLKVKRKLKLSTKIFFISLLIIFLTFFLTFTYFKKVNPKIIEITKIKINKITEQFLSMNIGYEILRDEVLEDILIIEQNKNEEIVYVDYNLEKAYKVLDLVSKKITSNLNNLEQGKIELSITDNNIKASKNGLILELPLFISSDNAFLTNLGPKVYIKVNFVGSVLTNIKTKITDYGMNNALIELYVTVEITEEIISPVVKKEEKINYDVLIAAKVINGKVPAIYGTTIEKESSIYKESIE